MIADPSLSVTGLNAEDLQKIIERFEQMPWLEEVLLFGSRAKGSAHEGSDIDLTIKGKGLTLVLSQLSYFGYFCYFGKKD